MKRKLELVTQIKIERTPEGIVIKSDRGFNWKADYLTPEVAITAVLGNQLAHTIDYENYFGNEFTVTLTVEHKNDENNI